MSKVTQEEDRRKEVGLTGVQCPLGEGMALKKSDQIVKGFRIQAEILEFYHLGQRELWGICGQGKDRMTSISSDYAISTRV